MDWPTFQSILFLHQEDAAQAKRSSRPRYFQDLNLDQVIGNVTAGKSFYGLFSFYNTPLQNIAAIKYRQAVAQDIDDGSLLKEVKNFAEDMVIVRQYLDLATKLSSQYRSRYHAEGWILAAISVYVQAVKKLDSGLRGLTLHSQGFQSFSTFLQHHVVSDEFQQLDDETRSLQENLRSLSYCIHIHDNWVMVQKYNQESDYSAEVLAFFEKFKQKENKAPRIDTANSGGLNLVENKILECIANLYPTIFKQLDLYCQRYQNGIDATIERFDREIQFYIAYHDYIEPMKQKGLSFCYPEVTKDKTCNSANECFDIALAHQLSLRGDTAVCNDYYLKDPERIFIVTGPNQGGKTTFARLFGQLHYLACLGLAVPGKEAHLFVYDNIFTHFETEEQLRKHRGKLKDDLVRVHAALAQASSNSLIILNEIFTSTTLQDAIYLSREIMEKISDLDAYCVCVTFLDEIAAFNEKTVSMVSNVFEDDSTRRTFKLTRKPADGLAYALSLVEKHGLTYNQLLERIQA